MKCTECGNEYKKVHGQYKVEDEYIGNFTIDSVNYYKCEGCGDVLLPLETAKRIEERRTEILEQWLRSQPLNTFISATETAMVLGISRQALHKHRRIRHGFIYHTTFGEKKVNLYLKKSVLQFKETGDGRFPIQQLERKPDYAEEIISGVYEVAISYLHRDVTTNIGPIFIKKSQTPSGGKIYVS